MATQNIISKSFEFYPPKSAAGMAALADTAVLLAKDNPDYFSVTFGAGGSTQAGTIDTIKLLQKHTKISVAPHLSCVGLTKIQVANILQDYQQLGINRLVVLRGDLPSGMGAAGEFNYAYELIEFIRATTNDYFHLEVAAYPEVHPQAKNARADLLNLKRKFLTGANGAITQYFFNIDAYFYFLDECAKEQIFMPIVPGIMPITQFAKLANFSARCGAEIPRWLAKRLENYADDLESIKSFGLEVVHRLCERLISGGAPGLHFYTLNQVEPSLKLAGLLKENAVNNHRVLY